MEELIYELEVFSGPLELLLKLVSETKIPIAQIRLADVTDRFIAYMQSAERFNIELASEFTVMATKLLYIKSLSLLPARRRAEQYSEEGDPEELLRERLIEYRKYKRVCSELEERYELFSRRGYRLPSESFSESEPLPAEADADDLRRVMLELLQRLPVQVKKKGPRRIIREPYTLEERMEELTLSITKLQSCRLERLFADCVSRGELVVSFLALLELMNKGVCTVTEDLTGRFIVGALEGGAVDGA